MSILFMRPVALLFTLLALFAEPRVGKAQANRLEEAGTTAFSGGRRSSRCSKHAVFSPLMAEPADAAVMPRFPGGAHICI